MEKAELVSHTNDVNWLWKFAIAIVILNGLTNILGYGALFYFFALTKGSISSAEILLYCFRLLSFVVPVVLVTNFVFAVTVLVAWIQKGSCQCVFCVLPWKKPQFQMGLVISLLCYFGCALFLGLLLLVFSVDSTIPD